jgi:UDP-N-acetylmuramoylalanine--D-glutamate ligase
MNFANKKVTILGLGKTGVATAIYLAKQGAQVFVSEGGKVTGEKLEQARELERLNIEVESERHSEKAFTHADLIVTSPGIPPTSAVIKRLNELGKEVISDIELASRETNVPTIAVTGTNGKSTTTALISFLLETSGLKAPACGNIGLPVFTALQSKPDYLVMEVSSYQAYYSNTFAPYIAIWLNLTPDHLDWHGDLNEYVAAKAKLFERQTETQFAVLNMDDKIVAATKTKAKIFPFSVKGPLPDARTGAFMDGEYLCYRQADNIERICHMNELQIIGRHNLENSLAAIAAVHLIGLTPKQIKEGLTKFKALSHRLEYVETIDGIACYNDSKATNTDSTIRALESFAEKVVLIAGGKDKGTDLAEFARYVKQHTAAVILLGEAKERFHQALSKEKVENIYEVSSIEEAIDFGLKLKAGPLLLSPACASFDMFRNFEDRGDVFKDIVRTRGKARGEKIAGSPR